MRANRHFIWTLGTALLLLAGVAEARRVALEDPARVEFGCELPMKKVQNGLRNAFINKGWTAKWVGNGHLVGKIIVRNKHTLVVNVKYNARQFDMNYKNSNNLKYRVENNQQEIHPNANKWMMNVVEEATSLLSSMCL